MKAPLADRIRPQSIDDIVGQKHLLGKGKALRNIIESGDLPNLIFYGPSGIGKTTLASIIALKTNRKFHKLNGTSASTADIKSIVAELDTLAAPNGILLYLDEIQYFNKRQQQSLLEYMEDGRIIDIMTIDKDKDLILPHSLAPTYDWTKMAFKGQMLELIARELYAEFKDGIWYAPFGVVIQFIGGKVIKEAETLYVEAYGHRATFIVGSKLAKTDLGTVEMSGEAYFVKNQSKPVQKKKLLQVWK